MIGMLAAALFASALAAAGATIIDSAAEALAHFVELPPAGAGS